MKILLFIKALSDKVEKLINQHQEDWVTLAEELEKLRTEAMDGRKTGEEGMSKEATTFYAHISLMKPLKMVKCH